MLKNYLKIAVRNIVKQKTFSFVTIFGFSIGLACFLLILSWGYDELSYDRFHEEHDQKYRLSVFIGMQNQSTRLRHRQGGSCRHELGGRPARRPQ